ncbi:MAG: thiamine pyrophosphate-dependent dehydrogenase E1 component subunit alpha, partial [Candidatus Nealsonbacteria bacterium]|nr:thiamine pyrophosphate-dependent dehydrogenase E1 component subunit alpha [Candidatus Nealsonbacteria bacterium]
GHYLAKGGSLRQLVAEIYTKESGCSGGRGGSMHLVSKDVGFYGSAPIVAGIIPLAVGSALANKIRKNNNIVVSFFGDGATGEGVLYESMNFAALRKLPVIFVCENNFYSTHLPVKEIRPDVQIYKIAEPFGIKTFQVDGNDVLKVYEIAKNAVDLCKKGEGPVFIEMLTYRLRGHVGPDDNILGDHIDIRPESEIENWKRKDPIPRFERYLWDKNISNEKEMADIKEGVKKEVEEAHKFAKESASPKS